LYIHVIYIKLTLITILTFSLIFPLEFVQCKLPSEIIKSDRNNFLLWIFSHWEKRLKETADALCKFTMRYIFIVFFINSTARLRLTSLVVYITCFYEQKNLCKFSKREIYAIKKFSLENFHSWKLNEREKKFWYGDFPRQKIE
jgi:hypothetical protein